MTRTVQMTREAWAALPPDVKAWRDGERWWIHPTTGDLVARVELLQLPSETPAGSWPAAGGSHAMTYIDE